MPGLSNIKEQCLLAMPRGRDKEMRVMRAEGTAEDGNKVSWYSIGEYVQDGSGAMRRKAFVTLRNKERESIAQVLLGLAQDTKSTQNDAHYDAPQADDMPF